MQILCSFHNVLHSAEKKRKKNFAYFSKLFYGASFQGPKVTSVPLQPHNFMCSPYFVTDYSKFKGSKLG
jgi:hypothetical protein